LTESAQDISEEKVNKYSKKIGVRVRRIGIKNLRRLMKIFRLYHLAVKNVKRKEQIG
jgi:hypothetical protein